MNRIPIASALLCALFSVCGNADDSEAMRFFETKIRPQLVRHCYECHSQESSPIQGGLLVDTRDGIQSGGDSGPAVVPHDPNAGTLLAALRYESFEMPPAGQLPEEVVRDFEKWIRLGAADPRENTGPTKTEPPGSEQWWAFQPPRSGSAASDKMRDRIDDYIDRSLADHGLARSPQAAPRTRLRRLWLTVTGLPPSDEQLAAFLSPEADITWEAAVDQALASPHFGEHWAAMWLNLARYAEDQAHIVGNNKALFYPNAWKYREWVIESLNADLPYDEFLRLQLAADLIEGAHEDNHAALGFIGLGPKYYRRNAPEVMADEWENQVDTVSRGLLGITLACARCHDHKYDPFPTEDYYAMAGIFAGTELFNRPESAEAEQGKNGHAKNPEQALHVVRDRPSAKDIRVQIRGNAERPGDVVPRGFPAVLTAAPLRFQEGSGRLELAKAITDGKNPLTARVFVNRVWERLIGRPLVQTPSNFGTLGASPSHPELLDDLAVRFMKNGWSLKWLCREILLSQTWQQTSVPSGITEATDPENRFLSHMNRQRLQVEQYRDAVLQVTGRLDKTVGGPSFDVEDTKQTRRTVYAAVSRLDLAPTLAIFDYPDPNVHSPGRVRTNTPLQKLYLLNSPFVRNAAAALSEQAMTESDNSVRQIQFLFRRILQREATEAEVADAQTIGISQPENAVQATAQLAQILLISNEFRFID